MVSPRTNKQSPPRRCFYPDLDKRECDALIKFAREQNSELEMLILQRTALFERVEMQQQRYNADDRLYKDSIADRERTINILKVEKEFEVAKAKYCLGSKEREALILKKKLDAALWELEQFKAWFDILRPHKCSDDEAINISPSKVYESLKVNCDGKSSSKEVSNYHSKCEKEVAELKQEYEKLSLKYASETSALKDENKFVWNQYKTMEDRYTEQLKTKNDEVVQANEKITGLLKSMEKFQSVSVEKDETITNLRANITKLEAEVSKKDGDISRITKEFELFRSGITDCVPLLNHASAEPSSSRTKTRSSSRKKGSAALEKDATSAQLRATISSLRAKINELEAEGNQKSEEISRLSKESELLRSKSFVDMPALKRCMNELSSSRSGGRVKGRKGRTTVEEEPSSMQPDATTATVIEKFKESKLLRSKIPANSPVLRHCTTQPPSSRSRGRSNGKVIKSASLKKDASSSQLVSKQVGTLSKRKQDDAMSFEDTPRLFTSQFKIPKLRSQSPNGR